MTVHAIIVAAGRGLRMTGTLRKQYCDLGGLPILSRTLSVFAHCPAVDRILLVVPKADFDFCKERILPPANCRKSVKLVPGGVERQDSVYNALLTKKYCMDDVLVIHDGVRPFLSCDRLTACIAEAQSSGACILGIPVVDTLKRVDDNGYIEQTVQREGMWQAQTPQAFQYHLLKSAHDNARKTGFSATDDALLVERLGERVRIIPGSLQNLKITTREDLVLADAVSQMR